MTNERDKCDCISRETVLNVINNPLNVKLDKIIEQLPSVLPMPKTGRWRKVSMDKYVQHAMYYYECSECKGQIIGEHNYCPNCGAKMEVVQNDNG